MITDPSPSRIVEIAPEDYSPEQKAAVEALLDGRGRLLTPYRVWLHSPILAQAMERLGTFLNNKSSLSEREVDLGIVLIAHHWAGEYVQAAHVRRCLQLGWPQSVMDAVRDDKTPAFDNPRDRSIYEVAQISQQAGPGSDEVFDRAAANLGLNGLAELIALFGYYSAVAIAMKLHRVPVPAAS